MAEMSAAIGAHDFDPLPVGVDMPRHTPRKLIVETRPAAVAVELTLGAIQRGVAPSADIGAGLLVLGVFADIGAFGSRATFRSIF